MCGTQPQRRKTRFRMDCKKTLPVEYGANQDTFFSRFRIARTQISKGLKEFFFKVFCGILDDITEMLSLGHYPKAYQ
jgi:hypothetical protein